MGKLKTIARRSFLVGSVAVLGGVAFGAYLYKRDVENPLLEGLGDDEASFNPFVKITSTDITLITPRADVGQGAYSVQAHMIAEELDLDLSTVKIEPGPPSAAYYNGIVVAEAIPIAATSDRVGARLGRGASDIIGKMMGLQITGGSSTVPDMIDRLRVAGAVARETLVLAAMQQTGLQRDQLNTDKGFVVLPDGNRLSYLELANTAAKLDPVRDITLKDPADWTYLGRDHLRTDIVAKSTGTQNYGIDFVAEGMVYATARTNPARGGGVKKVDASQAAGMRGVLKVFEITDGLAVIADNTWRAINAANTIKFEWGSPPYPASSAAQFEKVAASFRDDLQDSQLRDDGDVIEALTNADVIKADYKIPYLAHAPLEPMAVTVKLSDDRLDIWTGTQIPRFMQANAAKMLDFDAEQVHVHVLVSGGSFGRRLEDDYVLQAIEIAKQIPDTPVKLVWSREEDFLHDFPRPLAIAHGRGAVSESGIAAFDLAIAAPSVTESSIKRMGQSTMGPDVAIVAGAWDQPFAIPNYRVTGYRTPEMVPISSWRSVGASGNGFLHESFMDELCQAAGLDPMQERLRLCTHMPSQKVLEAVAEMSDWGSDPGHGRGRGLAFTLSFGVPVAEVVEVTNTEDGIKIDAVYVAADVGKVIDPVNFEAQVTGGVIWGLGHAMNCELTYANGIPEQDNYHAHEGMRLYQTPKIEVRGLENGPRIKGIGEPGVPPAAPALGNAIFAATGQRIRELPFFNHVDFV